MSMSDEQRDAKVIRDVGNGIVVMKARNRHDRRFKMLIIQDGDQILRELTLDQTDRAIGFALGYRMAKDVYELVAELDFQPKSNAGAVVAPPPKKGTE